MAFVPIPFIYDEFLDYFTGHADPDSLGNN